MKCFVGLDVSSQQLDACIILSDNSVTFSKSLSNDLVGVSEIKSQVLKLNEIHRFERIVIGMEATSLYSFHPAMFFNDNNNLKLLHTEGMIEQPNKIKRYREAFEENKNDTLDDFYIADYFRIERFTPSILKEEKSLALQQLTRTRLQLIEQLVHPKQHFTENIYYKCNTLPSELKNDDELSTSIYSATLITLMTENYTLDDLAETPIEDFSDLIQKLGHGALKNLTSSQN